MGLFPFNQATTINGSVSVAGDVSVTGHYSATGAAPGAVAGGNAGAGPPAPVVPVGTTDNSGIISFGTGTVPAAGVMVAVTFSVPWVVPGGGAPHIVVTPQNLATNALGIFVTGVSPTGFQVSCATAPAASQGNGTYSFAYHVIG